MLTEPRINAVVDICALGLSTVEVTDVEVTNGGAIDLGIAHGRDEIVTVDFQTTDNVDLGFIAIEESFDQVVWTQLCVMALNDGLQHRRIHRTARYLRYATRIEFTQPDAENPVNSLYLLSVKVLQ
jgi:hypothetical protein